MWKRSPERIAVITQTLGLYCCSFVENICALWCFSPPAAYGDKLSETVNIFIHTRFQLSNSTAGLCLKSQESSTQLGFHCFLADSTNPKTPAGDNRYHDGGFHLSLLSASGSLPQKIIPMSASYTNQTC